jgi:hypothetical protein
LRYRKINFCDIIDDDGNSFDMVPLLSNNNEERHFVPVSVIRCSGSLYVYLEPTEVTVTDNAVTDNAGVILKQTKDGLVAPSENECKKLGELFFNIMERER